MTNSKTGQTEDLIWNQHLRWLELVGSECKANQLKREREKLREASRRRSSGDIARPPA